jgi:hypothetical protein
MPRPSSSLHWLTLAVLLPLLVLGVLAWLGTRAQVKAAWSVAREEAKVAGAFVGEALPRELSAAVEAAPLFPDPPQPGVASAGDAVLDGNDLDALRKLRDDPAAGLSPAGLPRRVLAGFRVFEQTRDEADARVLTGLATVDAPSVLTPLVFEKVGEPDWRARWSRGDHARAIFRHHPDVPSSGKWIIGGDETWWLSSDGKELRFIAPAAFQQALASAAGRLPAWAGLRLSLGGTPVAGGSSTGEIMNASRCSRPPPAIRRGGLSGCSPSPWSSLAAHCFSSTARSNASGGSTR